MYIEGCGLQGDKLVITLRGKAPPIVDVEIPAALYNEEELKEAIDAALERREGVSRSLRQLMAIWSQTKAAVTAK
jgi:hypothetical protein